MGRSFGAAVMALVEGQAVGEMKVVERRHAPVVPGQAAGLSPTRRAAPKAWNPTRDERCGQRARPVVGSGFGAGAPPPE